MKRKEPPNHANICPWRHGKTTVNIFICDGAGNLVKTVDPVGYVTRQYFNARNIFYGAEKVINSRKSNIVKLEHDYEGNVVTIMKGLDSWLDEEYSKRTYEFDTLNRQTAIIDESSRRTDFTYDNNGNLIKKTDRNGVTTLFKYDGLNRLVEKINDKDGSRNSISITYDFLGNTKAIKDASGDRYFDYDILGRVKYINYSNGIRKYYNYDSSDRVTNFKVIQGGTEAINLSYEYDKSGRLTSVNENGRSFTYGYDDAGRLVKEENKVIGLESVYSYYPSGSLKSLMHYIAGDLKKTYSYKYDMRGNQAEKDENGIVTKYHYDPLGRLKAAELPSDRLQDYEYDDFGNRTKLVETEGNIIKETSYEYGIDSRLLLSGTKVDDDLTQKRLEYDPEGNLLKSLECFKYKGSLTAEKTISYHYDGYNQLSMVESPDANIYEYTYDSNGLRTMKAFGDEAVNYINEGGSIILETNKDMKITARNIRGSKLIYRETDLTYYGYIHNGHGDIIGLTDEKGNIIKDYSYDPFGRDDETHLDGFGDNRTVEIWRNEVDKIDNPFRYCGEYQDVETGNIYLRARYYDPEVGRFISEDSFEGNVTNPLSLNLYTYCEGNPLKYVDYSGHYVVPAAVLLYLGMVSASPDIQMDIQMIGLDLSQGNYLAAGLDTVGAFIPGATGLGKLSDEIAKITGGAGGRLTAALRLSKVSEYIRDVSKDIQIHHWINKATLKGKDPHPLIEKASQLGIDIIKEEWNKSPILGHNGSHLEEYYRVVRKELDKLYASIKDEIDEWAEEQMREALKEVAEKLKEQVLSGELKLNN